MANKSPGKTISTDFDVSGEMTRLRLELEGKIDKLEGKVDNKFSELEWKVDKKFDEKIFYWVVLPIILAAFAGMGMLGTWIYFTNEKYENLMSRTSVLETKIDQCLGKR